MRSALDGNGASTCLMTIALDLTDALEEAIDVEHAKFKSIYLDPLKKIS